jgi:hypothetical protein
MCRINIKASKGATTSLEKTTPFHKWLIGLAIASIFSIAYLLIPLYLTSAILSLALRYPST